MKPTRTIMSDVFKVKKSRDGGGTKGREIGTLDSLHERYIDELQSGTSEESIRELQGLLTSLKKELAGSFSPFVFEDVMRQSKLQGEHDELVRVITDAREKSEIQKYYLESGDLMLDYYAPPGKKTTSKVDFGSRVPGTFDKLFSVTEMSAGPSKKKMFDEYLSRRGLSNGLNIAENADNIKKMAEHCAPCNIPREEITSEGILVCPKCGSEEYALVVSDFPSFRDPPKERNNYAYKKQNHLNEILNQFQAKESTEIPDEVMNEVICEIRKRRIDNIALLTEQNIREILKKLGRNRYYEHAAHILSRLNGNPPPTITPEIEDKIRAMFQEVQAPYLLYCPDERRNFLSYSYIIYKFLELLELDEYKVHFPLLKSRDRLIQHDTIWKKICEYLQWEFIQSI
jgi:uncharacterized Zn finger protein (UPF0148 family)